MSNFSLHDIEREAQKLESFLAQDRAPASSSGDSYRIAPERRKAILVKLEEERALRQKHLSSSKAPLTAFRVSVSSNGEEEKGSPLLAWTIPAHSPNHKSKPPILTSSIPKPPQSPPKHPQPKFVQRRHSLSHHLSKKKSDDGKWDRLAKHKGHMYEQRERLKKEKERNERASMPFKPKLSSKATDLPDFNMPVQERLLLEADNIRSNRELLKRQKEEAEIATHSFKPKLYEPPDEIKDKIIGKKPIYERVGELQRSKRDKLHSLRMKIETTTNPSGQSSRKLSIDSEEKLGERLIKQGSLLTEKKLRVVDGIRKIEDQELTFQPKVNNKSKVIAKMKADGLSVVERQVKDANLRQHRMIQQEAATTQKFTGQNEKRAIPKDKIERWALHDKQRQIEERNAMAEEYYSQFTFQPQVNPISSRIAKAHSLDELVVNERGSQCLQEAIQDMEEEFKRDCTFEPKFMPSAVERKSHFDFHDSDNLLIAIEQDRQRRKRNIEQKRKQTQNEKLRECTFEPKFMTKDKKVNMDKPVAIRGLGRHLELRDLARRKEEEKKNREEEVFGRTSSGPMPSFTIPKPFNLHGKTKKPQISMQESRSKEEGSTFHKKQLSTRLMLQNMFEKNHSYAI